MCFSATASNSRPRISFKRMPQSLAARSCGADRRYRPDAIKIAAQCDSLADGSKRCSTFAQEARGQHRGHAHGRGGFAGAVPGSARERRVCLRAGGTRHRSGPDFARRDEAPLSRGRFRRADARLRRDRRPHRPFAFAGNAERGIRGAPDERGLSAVSGARPAGFSRLGRAAGHRRIQRDDAAQGAHPAGISTVAIRWRQKSAR